MWHETHFATCGHRHNSVVPGVTSLQHPKPNPPPSNGHRNERNPVKNKEFSSLPEDLSADLRGHIRPVFVPLTLFERDASPAQKTLRSKLAGRPFLLEGESWPTCPNCSKPMALFVQLDTATLPKECPPYGEGLIQLFYCQTRDPLCEVDCEAYAPFSRCILARSIPPSAAGSTAPLDLAERDEIDRAQGVREAQIIIDWKRIDDLPGYEELDEDDLSWDDRGDTVHELERPIAGEKLAGWPLWIQSPEHPPCPRCKEPMQLVFQIDSNDLLGVQFGDLGCGHLTQCPTHKDILTFGWACG